MVPRREEPLSRPAGKLSTVNEQKKAEDLELNDPGKKPSHRLLHDG